MGTSERLARLDEKKRALLAERAEAQKDIGRWPASKRVGALLDQGSFVETDAWLTGGAAVAGFGLVNERPCAVIAQDVAQDGGAMSEAAAKKMKKVIALAADSGMPLVMLLDSLGAKVEEGAKVLAAYAAVFEALVALSGRVPLIAAVAGPCLGANAHIAALADFTVVLKDEAQLLPVSVNVQNAVSGKTLDAKTIGGAEKIAAAGLAAAVADDEGQMVATLRQLIDLLPASDDESAPYVLQDDLNRLIPANLMGTDLLGSLADVGTILPVYCGYGKAHTALARLGGNTVLLVGFDPEDGGRLDGQSCQKIARLVRFCDAFNIPVVTVIDSEGLAVLGGEGQLALLGASTKMLFEYAAAGCPKVALITGNAVGDSYVSLAGKAVADLCYGWPSAYVAPLTAQTAAATFDADRLAEIGEAALVAAREDAYDGLAAAQQGLLDEMIDPARSRQYLISAIELLNLKQAAPLMKKHGNQPL